MESQNYSQLDLIFDALGNEHRRRIIDMLALRPASISQLADQQNLSLPAIHKHIAVLEAAKLVNRKKSGRTNFLALNKRSLLALQDWVMRFHAYWGNDEESLENYVAGIKKYELAKNN